MDQSEAQHEILGIVWQRGPTTVREAWKLLGKKTGYTSILKLMNSMHSEGLLRCEDSPEGLVYSAKRNPKRNATGLLAADLMKKAFSGDEGTIRTSLSHEVVTSGDLERIRDSIEVIESK